MSNTLQTSANWAACFVGQITLTGGTGNEPALSCANMIIDTLLGPPFKWAFNRNTQTITLSQGTQDYSETFSDFGFLERATVIPTTGSGLKQSEIKDVYNNECGPIETNQARPNALYVQLNNPATPSQSFRFVAAPDQAYTATLFYQKLPVHMTGTSSGWSGIPDVYENVYNTLFLAEMFELAGSEQKAAYYRQRGVMSLLALAEGLTDTDKNLFLEQYLGRDAQMLTRQLRTQQGNQARGV